MKFREGRDKEFLADVRARAADYFAGRGVGRHGDGRVAAKGVVLVVVAAGLYGAILSNRLPGPALLAAALLYGVACILISFNLAHDAAHEALSGRRWVNRVVYVGTFLLNGTSAYLWKRRHVGSHHTFPNVKGGDADMDDNPFLRVSPASPYRRYFRYQHLYAPFIYALFSLYSVFLYDFAFFFRDRLANIDLRAEVRRPRVLAIVALEKAVYLGLTLVVPILVIDRPAWQVALGFVAMQLASSLAFTMPLVSTHIAEGIAFPEADDQGRIAGSWAAHQLATSMDYSPESRLANWLLGAVNAHAAHHLFPDVCHVHYVPLSRIIRETASEYGVRYNAMSYPAALRSHFPATSHAASAGPSSSPSPSLRGFRPVRKPRLSTSFLMAEVAACSPLAFFAARNLAYLAAKVLLPASLASAWCLMLWAIVNTVGERGRGGG